jgi:hypothetical protein
VRVTFSRLPTASIALAAAADNVSTALLLLPLLLL